MDKKADYRREFEETVGGSCFPKNCRPVGQVKGYAELNCANREYTEFLESRLDRISGIINKEIADMEQCKNLDYPDEWKLSAEMIKVLAETVKNRMLYVKKQIEGK